ncbi:regulatory protein suaprga1, variant 2 [Coprinopsis cinerea AmutBmut pab1-1]|nr:regulatory protein suaprga1 [Coprinopsis cinerea AmutBmut pab1-1]KAG2008913.1 regulatory protein suaprga1, variant 2 [Coprinopsis cinerea AmutBmut pab1-1]
MSALRALRQVVRVSARTRFTPVATRYAVSRPVFANQLSRAFSVSAAKFGSGATDVALSQKLAEELRYEQTENAEASSPDFVQEFLQQGTWTIEDTPGQDEVALVRKFGDEHIRLIFSIADIQADPEDFEAHNEIEGEDIDDSAASYPLRTSLTITKSNAPGSLNIDMIAQEGHFMVENVSFYDDAKLGTEADRRGGLEEARDVYWTSVQHPRRPPPRTIRKIPRRARYQRDRRALYPRVRRVQGAEGVCQVVGQG